MKPSPPLRNLYYPENPYFPPSSNQCVRCSGRYQRGEEEDTGSKMIAWLNVLKLLVLVFSLVSVAGAENTKGRVKFLVFGDSFADTGNNADLSLNNSAFREPFGMTWPGRPTGRASDGYCLTDIIASFLKQSPPPTYKRWVRKSVKASQLQYGMNFAYGGSGVLPAWENLTLALQIAAFKQVVEENVFTGDDLENSVALVSVVGNDVSHYIHGIHGPLEKFAEHLKNVRNQLVLDIKSLQSMGIRKLILNTLSPGSCYPAVPQCIEHNQLFREEIVKLKKNSTIVVLEYEALQKAAVALYDSGIRDPVKPCCQAQPGYFCGNRDRYGKKMYSVCDHPELAFIFNEGHISHDGWKKIYSLLLKSNTLEPLL